jgi:hypothetical protein
MTTPIPAAKLPAAGAPADAPLSARHLLGDAAPSRFKDDICASVLDDMEGVTVWAVAHRPARRIVPQESRLVMFFRDNGEDVTTYFAIFAAASALAVVLAGYWGALS